MNVPRDDLSLAKRPLHKKAPRIPRVHIFVSKGESFELSLPVSLPMVGNDMAKTLEAAGRSVPTLTNGINFAVVIHGTNVTKYPKDVFLWLCGIGPDPSGKDPNWLGGKSDAT